MSSRLYLAKITVWLLLMLGGYGVVQAQNQITSLSIAGGASTTAACGGSTISIVPSIQTTNPTTVTAVVYSPVLNGVVQTQFNGSGAGFNGVYTIPAVNTSSTLVVQATGYFSDGSPSSTASLTVTVFPSVSTPVTTTVTPGAICAGGSSTVTVPSGLTITSAFGPGFLALSGTPTETLSLTTSPTADGIQTYSLVVSNASGCTALATANLTVNPIPTVAFTPASGTITCASGAVSLTANATGGSSFTYTFAGGGGIGTFTAVGGVVTLPYVAGQNFTGSINVTAVSAAGCSNTATAPITYNTLPAANGPSVTITAAGSLNGAVLNATTSNTGVAGAVCQGTTLALSVSGCVAAPAGTTAVIPNDPVIYVSGPGGVTIIGATTSTTAPGGTGITVFAIPTNITTVAGSPFVYTIPCIASNGCSSTSVASLSLTVNPTPTASPTIVSSSQGVIASGASVTICEKTLQSLTVTCPTGTSIAAAGISSTSGATGFGGLPTGSPLAFYGNVYSNTNTAAGLSYGGSYTVACYNSSSCVGPLTTYSVTVNPAPNDASLTVVGGTGTTVAGAGSGSVSICSGNSLTVSTNCLISLTQNTTAGTGNPILTGGTTGFPGIDNGGAGAGTGGGTTPGSSATVSGFASFNGTFTATTTQTYVYTFVCTNTFGCSSSAVTSLSITVNPTPAQPTLGSFTGGITAASTTVCQSNAVRTFAASCPTVGTASVVSSGTGITTAGGNVTVAAGSTGAKAFTIVCATSSCTSTAALYSFTVTPAPNTASLTVTGGVPATVNATAAAGGAVTVCAGSTLAVRTDCLISTGAISSSTTGNPPFIGSGGGTGTDGGASGTATTGGGTTTPGSTTSAFASFSATFGTVTTTPLVYTFVCTSASGCSSLSVTSLTVTVAPQPVAPTLASFTGGITAASTTVCQSNAIRTFVASCSIGTPSVVSSGTDITTAGGSVTVAAGSTGAKAFTIVCATSSCTSTAALYSFTVTPAPNTASLTVTGGVPATVNATAAAGGAVTVCAGSTLVVRTDCVISTGAISSSTTGNPPFIGSGGATGTDGGASGTATTGGGSTTPGSTTSAFASFSATFGTVTTTPLVYTFVCTNASGCSSLSVTSLTVTVTSQPVAPTVSGFTAGTVCQSNSPIIASAACATGETAYVRVSGNNFAIGTLGQTTSATISPAANTTGVYGYTAVCGTSSCTSTAVTRSLTITAAPNNASLTLVSAGTGSNIAGTSATVCSGQSLTVLTNCFVSSSTSATTITPNPPFTPGSNGVGGSIGGGAVGGGVTSTSLAFYTASFTSATTQTFVYTLVCTNSAGCSSLTATSFTVTVNPTPAAPQPVASVGTLPSLTACQGSGPISVSANCATGSTLIGGRVAGTTAPGSVTAGAYSIGTGVNGVGTGSYTIACQNSSGCVSSVYTFSVTVNEAPNNATVTASASGNTLSNVTPATPGQVLTICRDQPVSLTIVGCTRIEIPGQGTISGGITGGSTSAIGGISGGGTSPTTQNTLSAAIPTAGIPTGVYTVTLACASSAGCSSTLVTSFSLNITDAPTASVSVSGFASTCNNAQGPASGTLSCSTGYVSYTLTNAAGSTALVGTSIASYTASAAGTYTLAAQCSTAPACAGPVSTVVFNNRTATPEPTNISALPNSICAGTTTVLSVSGCAGGVINWYVSGSNAIIGTGSSITVAPTASTGYQANCTLNGCTSGKTTAALVTVTPIPSGVPSLQALPNPVAAGASVTLTAFGCPVGSQVIIYSDAAGTTEVGRTATGSLVVNPTVSTTYYGACFNGTCRGNIGTGGTPVSVQACNFVATVTPSSATLCPGGSVVLTSSGGASYVWNNGAGNVQQITVQAPGVYNVVVTNASGCTALASATVVAGASPVVAISGNTNIVQGQTAMLTASGGVTYLWSTGAVTPTISTQTAGVYSVTVTSAAGCTAVGQTTVTVQPLPAAPTVTPGTNLQACLGQNVVLTASCPTGSPRFNRGNVSFNQPTYSVESPVVGPVSVNVVCVVNGVEGTATPVTVTFNAAPNVSIAGDGKICVTSGVVTGATLTASGATSYLWSTGATTPSITVTTPGPISVTGTTTGCSNVAQINTFSAICGTNQPLAITGASINCTTRQITITTAGGDGTSIDGRIILVTNFQPMAQPLILDAGVFSERKPVQLQVRQSGAMSSIFTFDYSAQCPGGGVVTTPPTSTTTAPPTGNAVITVCGQPYTLGTAPFSVSSTFTCNPGTTPHLINFMPTGGVNDANSVIEFMSIGITPWTQSCSETLDLNNTDNNMFTVFARQRNTQTGAILASAQITVTSPCVRKDGAGREATSATGELDVTVLGNPTLGDKVEVEVRGAEGQSMQLRMTNGQGSSVSEIVVEKANAVERQTIGLGRSAGMYFLQVITPTKVKTVKVIRQ